MNAGQTTRTRGFGMTLPADWSILPLDPRTRDRRIAGLVERRVGREDRLAYVRRQCVVRLRKAAADASDRGAFFAALHNGAVKGLPLAASAMALITPPATDASGTVLSDPHAIAGHLADGGADDPGTVLDHSVVTLQLGQAARIRRRAPSGFDALDGTEVLAESFHFYVPLPEVGKTLGLIFSTPLLSVADSYARLFDSMAVSARWVPREAAPASGPQPEREAG